MKKIFKVLKARFLSLLFLALLGHPVSASDFVVYSVFRSLNLGYSNEPMDKDYYINMGAAQGLKKGATLEVLRHIPTYDLVNSQAYRDMTFPIARVKVIHVEARSAIARLEKMLPADQIPVIQPKAIMVGDYVRYPQP